MTTNELDRLRRKEIVGIAALVFWLVLLIGANLPALRYTSDFVVVNAGILGWTLTAAWVAMDASYRRQRYVLWGLFTLMIAPLAFILYYLTRRYVQPVCLQCGAILRDSSAACPACGAWTLQGRMRFHAHSLYNSLSGSLVRGPAERAKETVKHMSFALAAVVVVGAVLLSQQWNPSPLMSLLGFVWTLSFAAYWVLVAWWVYLDGMWRRMEAVPWAILTLVTNVIGLVTYLVIRYPDPRTCPACGASLGTGLKRCPYCGAEAEPVCPRCQAPIRSDWVYCPSCSTKLPSRLDQPAPQPAASGPAAPATLTISGVVTDALTAAPIANAEVKIDARSNAPTTVTDALGRFAIADLAPRPYVVIASAPGYAAASQAYTPSATAAAQLHFSLYPVDQNSSSSSR